MEVTEANGQRHQYVMTPGQARDFERQLHRANRQLEPPGINAAERGH